MGHATMVVVRERAISTLPHTYIHMRVVCEANNNCRYIIRILICVCFTLYMASSGFFGTITCRTYIQNKRQHNGHEHSTKWQSPLFFVNCNAVFSSSPGINFRIVNRMKMLLNNIPFPIVNDQSLHKTKKKNIDRVVTETNFKLNLSIILSSRIRFRLFFFCHENLFQHYCHCGSIPFNCSAASNYNDKLRDNRRIWCMLIHSTCNCGNKNNAYLGLFKTGDLTKLLNYYRIAVDGTLS